MPARGGRVAHNKRKGKDKCKAAVATAEGAGAAAPADNAAAAPTQPAIKLIGEAAEKYGNRASANDDGEKYPTKLKWAQALQRAFFLHALACPCGGRRRIIAAILDKRETERILKHSLPP